MLKTKVLHPEILDALGRIGHLSKVLITDGNYPHATHPNPMAPIVWANFRPGLLDATTTLEIVCDVAPIEEASVMQPAKEGEFALDKPPAIWDAFRKVLKERAEFGKPLIELPKPEFHTAARGDDVGLVIATGEMQGYANVLLTLGVVRVGW